MAVSVFLASLLSVAYWPLVYGALYTDPSSLPKLEYDFVIVGGGTAGNVLANRLTANSAYSVLVVEAGLSNTAVVDDEVPFLDISLTPDTSITWNYTTTAQTNCDNRVIPYPRGRVLGGSSTVNLLVWTRGSVDDWNRLATATGDNGWSWNELLPYMKKSEDLVESADDLNYSCKVDPSVHGTSGPIQISLEGYPVDIDQRILGMTQEDPPVFDYNLDMNDGYPIGLGWAQNAIGSTGHRSSSATEYLDPVLSRSNLDVLIMTTVTKLISTSSSSDGTPAFTQVEIAQSASSERYTVQATKEILLCAGTIGTPQILQLSGIGDPTFLKSVGVTPLVDLPGVGQNLIDHPLVTNNWLVNSNDTVDRFARNATLADEEFEVWSSTGGGPFVDNGVEQIGWLRVPSEITDEYGDPSAGSASPHLEFIITNGWVSWVSPRPATGNYLTVLTVVASPGSHGSVQLASNDPFDNPLINPNYYSDPFDLAAMIYAVQTAQSFINGTPWDGYVIAPAPALAAAQTEAEVEAYVRDQTTTIWHPVGTARMSANSSDTGAVVTNELLVKNTTGLRIIDASVLPYIPAAHTQAGVYAVAERAADLIMAAWSN